METKGKYEIEALEYIAKLADGGCRDSITYLDKCLAYSKDLTVENVVEALGTTDYDTMRKLTNYLIFHHSADAVKLIEDLHNSGKELKQFVRQYVQFLLDINKYGLGCDWKYLQLPRLEKYEDWLREFSSEDFDEAEHWLSVFVNLNADIKWSQSVKYDVECAILINYGGVK